MKRHHSMDANAAAPVRGFIGSRGRTLVLGPWVALRDPKDDAREGAVRVPIADSYVTSGCVPSRTRAGSDREREDGGRFLRQHLRPSQIITSLPSCQRVVTIESARPRGAVRGTPRLIPPHYNMKMASTVDRASAIVGNKRGLPSRQACHKGPLLQPHWTRRILDVQ